MTDSQRCLKAYGDPRSAAFRQKWLKIMPLPADILPYWPKYQGLQVTRIEIHTFAWPALLAVFRELIRTGLIKEMKTYDGCGNIRPKRGLGEWSIHSWNLALDFNALQNPLGVAWGSRPGMFSKAFIAVWTKYGWESGALWPRGDNMHFQYTKNFPS